MVEMDIAYDGNLICTAAHGPSGTTIRTAAPKDNQGDGSSFSPTDLVATALASCIVTTIAIVAKRNNIEIGPITAHVQKEMATAGIRRIARLPVVVKLGFDLPAEQRTRLENAGNSCPVHKSLHPDVDAPITFEWASR